MILPAKIIDTAILPLWHPYALATMSTSFGAEAKLYWLRGGHELPQDNLAAPQQWPARKSPKWQNRNRLHMAPRTCHE